jgi:hypothetical protein
MSAQIETTFYGATFQVTKKGALEHKNEYYLKLIKRKALK